MMTVVQSVGMLVGMLLFSEIGRRAGIARLAFDPDGTAKGAGPVEGFVFGLLGLLLAFTFSGAASRFEDRRHLIAEETNAIGTAYLRVDVLPQELQPEVRELFRRYIGVRIAEYQQVTDSAATNAAIREVADLQARIWAAAVSGVRRPDAPTSAAVLLLPALNEMIDITTTRAVAMQNHPPRVIFWLLGGLSLVCALLSGYAMAGMKTRNLFYSCVVAVTMSFTLYVILDLEYPRFGLIRIDAADQNLIDLQESMR